MKKGEWVTFERLDEEGRTHATPAIIEYVGRQFLKIRPYLKEKGKFIDVTMWREVETLTPYATNPEQEDLETMIDLALDIGDKEWFYELSNQLEGVRSWPRKTGM